MRSEIYFLNKVPEWKNNTTENPVHPKKLSHSFKVVLSHKNFSFVAFLQSKIHNTKK